MTSVRVEFKATMIMLFKGTYARCKSSPLIFLGVAVHQQRFVATNLSRRGAAVIDQPLQTHRWLMS